MVWLFGISRTGWVKVALITTELPLWLEVMPDTKVFATSVGVAVPEVSRKVILRLPSGYAIPCEGLREVSITSRVLPFGCLPVRIATNLFTADETAARGAIAMAKADNAAILKKARRDMFISKKL